MIVNKFASTVKTKRFTRDRKDQHELNMIMFDYQQQRALVFVFLNTIPLLRRIRFINKEYKKYIDIIYVHISISEWKENNISVFLKALVCRSCCLLFMRDDARSDCRFEWLTASISAKWSALH